jgi:hypothetical protein
MGDEIAETLEQLEIILLLLKKGLGGSHRYSSMI